MLLIAIIIIIIIIITIIIVINILISFFIEDEGTPVYYVCLEQRINFNENDPVKKAPW